MSYLFTLLLLSSLMYFKFLPPQIIIPLCFVCVIVLLGIKRIILHKSLFYIHVLWSIFFMFVGLNYFHYHNREFSSEFLLLICLTASMYIGIYCGINFKKNLLNIFVAWVFLILYQLFTLNTIFQVFNERWTITTGWLNSNAVGAMLVFAMPLLLLCFYINKSKVIRIIVVIEIITSCIVLFLLSSRGSILALSTILIFMVILSKKKLRNFTLIILSLAIFFVISLKFDFLKNSINNTLTRIFSVGLNGRDSLWTIGLESIKSNPIYGIGARNGIEMDLHNPILHIAVHYGLFTVTPFAILLLSPIFLLEIKQFKSSYILFIFSTYLAIIVQSSFEAILTPLITGCIAWYFIGLTYGFLMKNKYFELYGVKAT